VYVSGYREIEAAMITLIPNLRKTQRREVLDYMELIVDEVEASDANMIAFKNGIYDIAEDRLMPFSSNMVVTNKIPWNYNPSAYCELADNTLDKLACDDESIRSLLEECIGYCFYRRNELGKAFILTGDKNNGKSTFLDCVKAVMGDDNISALDLKELGDRFSTSMMFGKLANVGDDIGDDFLQGSQVAVFKKIVTGNRIKAERKGQDPFEFNPYVKLLFSANNIPRMKDKTGAVLRRLVIIPFNARFSKTDKDYDPFIKYKLIQEDSMEYLISLGIEGLKRVITNNGFTQSRKVQKELEEYEQANNPIISFIREYGVDAITYEPTNEVYQKYQSYCIDNSLTTMSNTVFSKQINMRLGLEVITKRVNGKVRRIFVPATEEKK
jgi:putative DNA primase/helicase